MKRLILGFGLCGSLFSMGCMGQYKATLRNYAESNLTTATTIQTLLEAVKCDPTDAAKAKECSDAVEKIKKVTAGLEKDSQDLKAKAQ